MTELPDDELDKLFRKSSEEFDPTFDPNDWNELKTRLDAEDGIRQRGWLRKWWPLGIVLLFMTAGMATFFGLNEKTVKPTEMKTSKINTDKANQPAELDSGKAGIANAHKIVTSEKNGYEKNIAVKPALTKSKSEKILPLNRSKAGGVFLEPNRSEGKGGEGAFSSTKKTTELQKKSVVAAREAVVNQLKEGQELNGTEESPYQELVINDGSKSGNQENAGSERNVLKVSKKTLNAAIQISQIESRPLIGNNVLTLPAVILPNKNSDFVKPEKEHAPVPKLAVRFGYSPDLSSVGLKNFSKPGAAFSLLAEFAVMPKLYLQTGVVRSVKEYSAKGNEYIFRKYVTDIATPVSVDGTCEMIEIPLGFRYDLVQNERSRWFAGTGMTSYYIQKEKYDYHYSGYVHNAKPGWEGKTGWFWLSHMNASAGYEYRISKKLSLLAEPYVRIPVKRVGYGKVNLTTTGIWIALRYTPVFR